MYTQEGTLDLEASALEHEVQAYFRLARWQQRPKRLRPWVARPRIMTGHEERLMNRAEQLTEAA